MTSQRAPTLVVEDDEDTRESLELLLRDCGYETTSVKDVADALAYLHANPACSIILDLHLPGRPGTDLLRELTADPALIGIPVIVFSADPHGTLAPAAAVVRKGDDPDVLLAAVAAHCRRMCR